MKKILALVFVLSMSLTYAQPGGGGGMGGSQQGGGQRGSDMQQQEKMPEFNAAQVAGIFKYDVDEAMKKSKIKKDKKLIQEVSRAIGGYNLKMDEISLLNKDNFDTLNVYVNTSMKTKRGERSNQETSSGNSNSRERSKNSKDDPKALISAKIEPAKNAVKKAEQNLNKTLEALLSEKQYGKWLKYQEKIKEEKQPKTPSNSSQGNEQGGGMGGPPGGGMR
ncbi:hypothetical protein EV196_11081 [Mariniflexile fucanivorans]|uniref:Uncharacterized protein n=1 Tax=Mariniflexile fucanivorans TaxID=264023 RepID=A0A4R1RBJ7_9FLAO|nr:hypothetical protein [Mariniflexile fucanivorans]TCL63128.1 hypothetical protein EV196_11081 [Mariniflexile fucanivorans]